MSFGVSLRQPRPSSSSLWHRFSGGPWARPTGTLPPAALLRVVAAGPHACSMAKPLPVPASASKDRKDLLFEPTSWFWPERGGSAPGTITANGRMQQEALAGGSNEQLQILQCNFFLNTAICRLHISLSVEIPLTERPRQPWTQHKLQSPRENRVTTRPAHAELCPTQAKLVGGTNLGH